MAVLLKKCKKCGLKMPIESFAKDKLCKDGHIGSCKKCIKANLKKNCICIACGDGFYAAPSRILKGYGKYCSDICKSSGINNPRYIVNDVNCKNCGKAFHIKPYQQKSGKGKVYCSVECRLADTRTIVKCGWCSNDFEVQRCKVGKEKYCSPECSQKAVLNNPRLAPKSTKLNCICKTCEKLFYTKPSDLKRGNGVGTYCSAECMTGSRKAKRIDGVITSYLEEIFLNQLIANNLTVGMKRELQFRTDRKWRFDFAWVEERIAVEIQGGVWMGKSGSHTSRKGLNNDCEKRNEAVIDGWRVLHFTSDQVHSEYALDVIKRLMKVLRFSTEQVKSGLAVQQIEKMVGGNRTNDR
ncbi:hypothetical protein QDR54_13675 [Acinetobacter baumannii]|uniref:hypothetical protein n=1 Tax=Acinetobacter baumannii TaxID=470 RepID=UPI00244A427C|nr:hypothetical protein [Acinetobacter baumannii]MDH2653939.1 hypothetical protein [Acinetobacter baumannii]